MYCRDAGLISVQVNQNLKELDCALMEALVAANVITEYVMTW